MQNSTPENGGFGSILDLSRLDSLHIEKSKPQRNPEDIAIPGFKPLTYQHEDIDSLLQEILEKQVRSPKPDCSNHNSY